MADVDFNVCSECGSGNTDMYGKHEDFIGFQCMSCGHTWEITLGDDSGLLDVLDDDDDLPF